MVSSSVYPPAQLVERVAGILGARPVAWEPVAGGYTAAGRWVVRGENGRAAFVKVATNPNTTEWLRAELRIYSQLAAPFLPAVLGWDAAEPPLLVLEDLSRAFWPPPWSPTRTEAVLATLAQVAATPAPPGLPEMVAAREELSGWARVAEDTAPFLALGACSTGWLEAALPALLRAEDGAVLVGETLAHFDVRSDNICFVADGKGGERAVLVDWNWACRGNHRLDIAAWLPSLRAEGGPAPETILSGEPELAALVSGYFASKAGLPGAAARLRALQLRQLRAALPWAALELDLPPPDGNCV